MNLSKSSHTILVIEPDGILAKLITQMLVDAGHYVVVATSASQGLQQLDTYNVSLIVLELQLPLHNGVEFLYEIRSYADWQDIPVIVFSSISKEVYVSSDALSRLGVVRYLQKPYASLKHIVQEIETVPIR